MSKVTRKSKSGKAANRPKKPYPDFPLYAHPLGYWSKKIKGTIRHFGRWGRVTNGLLSPLEGDTWQEALALFKAEFENVATGRTGPGTVVTPRKETDDGLRVRDLANQFLTAKLRLLESGEIGARTFQDYRGQPFTGRAYHKHAVNSQYRKAREISGS